MDLNFEHRGYAFTLVGAFEMPSATLKTATKIAADAFITYEGLAKSRSRQILIKKWDRQCGLADVGLWEGWQVIWCDPADVFQIVYQLGHEFGHVAMGHYKRFDRPDNHQWIDEIVCGACSLHATEYAGNNWNANNLTKEDFRRQFEFLKINDFPSAAVRDKPIPVGEFETLVKSSGFAKEMWPYTGRLFEMVTGPQIIADLPGLAEVPPGLTWEGYLQKWKDCTDGGKTPTAFEEMIASH
jgi:hypothetical protein